MPRLSSQDCHGAIKRLGAGGLQQQVATTLGLHISITDCLLMTFPEAAHHRWQQQHKTAIRCNSTGRIPI